MGICEAVKRCFCHDITNICTLPPPKEVPLLHEQEFICWHANQTEDDGKEIKATSIRSAAKKAVDIWRHENIQELGHDKVTVFVKDEARRVHEVIITQEGDSSAPEAFA
jgi:hypothetical protein